MTVFRNKKYYHVYLPIILVSILALSFFSCMGKSAKSDEDEIISSLEPTPMDLRSSQYNFFYTAFQGNPLCMIVAVQQLQVPTVFGKTKVKGKANAWLVSPGLSKYIFSEKGTFKKDPGAPLNLVEDSLLLTTDKDEWAFYFPYNQEEYLIISNPVYPSRVRTDQGREIQYGRMPAKFLWKNRKIEGNLFYERRELPEEVAYSSVSPFASLEPGVRGYLLWAPDGEVLYIEKSGEIGRESRARIAVMQDRRGRWQETYDVDWQEPACAFSQDVCAGSSDSFQFNIPLWNLQGEMEILSEIQGGLDAEKKQEGPSPEDTTSLGLFWTSLQGIPQKLVDSPLDFCVLKGSLKIDREIRTVYGVGMLAK